MASRRTLPAVKQEKTRGVQVNGNDLVETKEVAGKIGIRDNRHPENLESAARYIEEKLRESGFEARYKEI